MADHADECTLAIDDGELVEIVGEHQDRGLEQRCILLDCQRWEADALQGGHGFGPGGIAIDPLAIDHLQQVDSVDATHRHTLVVDQKDVVPFTLGHDMNHTRERGGVPEHARLGHDLAAAKVSGIIRTGSPRNIAPNASRPLRQHTQASFLEPGPTAFPI
jgi:hypothetical protein